MSNMTERKHLLSLFLILITPVIEILNLQGNSMYVLPDNGLKIHAFSIYRIKYPTRSFINPIINSIYIKFLEKIYQAYICQN